MRKRLNVVVTGDVDSGKSTLIGRLLYELDSVLPVVPSDIAQTGDDFEFAYLLDSLQEEREGKLTIDTAQAFCRDKRGKEFVFIDVPGHKELLKNMLCGSSYADIAVFVVDMHKSIAEQARRHAFILKFLGITNITVVFNKMDEINFDADTFFKIGKIMSEFFITNIGVRPKSCIPVSAKYADNLVKNSKRMPWYKGKPLIRALDINPDKEGKAAFRFSLQDIYNFNGAEIIAGRVISGRIVRGGKVVVLPLQEERIISGIKVFDKSRYSAAAPANIGLVLNDMRGLVRGQIIAKPKFPEVTKEIQANILCVRRFDAQDSLVFKCLTQETAAQIKQIDDIWDIEKLEPQSRNGRLEDNDFARITLTTKDFVAVEKFERKNSLGRFVLENRGEICAIGSIL